MILLVLYIIYTSQLNCPTRPNTKEKKKVAVVSPCSSFLLLFTNAKVIMSRWNFITISPNSRCLFACRSYHFLRLFNRSSCILFVRFTFTSRFQNSRFLGNGRGKPRRQGREWRGKGILSFVPMCLLPISIIPARRRQGDTRT